MTTEYAGIPGLSERLMGAGVVLLGRVQKQVDAELHMVGEKPEVHSVFSVAVEDVLEGELDGEVVTVRVVGGRAENVETAWSVELEEGARMLFVLSPDYGPERGSDAFVPSFAGCSRVDDDLVQLPEGRTRLPRIRSLMRSARRARDAEVAALEELEPARLRRRPYEPVLEMPEAPGRGAAEATPDEGPSEQRRRPRPPKRKA